MDISRPPNPDQLKNNYTYLAALIAMDMNMHVIIQGYDTEMNVN